MAALCRRYLELARVSEVEPDIELLGPIVETFDSIQWEDSDDEDSPSDEPAP